MLKFRLEKICINLIHINDKFVVQTKKKLKNVYGTCHNVSHVKLIKDFQLQQELFVLGIKLTSTFFSSHCDACFIRKIIIQLGCLNKNFQIILGQFSNKIMSRERYLGFLYIKWGGDVSLGLTQTLIFLASTLVKPTNYSSP